MTLRVRRASTEPSPRRWTQDYTVSLTPRTTVLSALMEARDQHDGSLAFRASCRQGICGSCAVEINGRPGLACTSLLADHVDRRGRVRVAPLAGFTPVRDMVVDLGDFWSRYRAAEPWLESPSPLPSREFRVAPAEVRALAGADECILCGACVAACPVARGGDEFVGPAALVRALVRVADPRDARPDARLRALASGSGALRCHGAGECVPVCPMHIDVADAIAALRRGVERRAAVRDARVARRDGLTAPRPPARPDGGRDA